MPDLSWKHHTLLQALLSRGPLKEAEFHSIFAAVTGKNPNAGGHRKLFTDCLLSINKELAYIQFELRACCNQYDGNVYYGVVNNVADQQSKLGTNYSVPQIAFFKAVIEAILQDGTAQGSISNIEALNVRLENQVQNGIGSESQDGQSNIPPALRNFSISQKEKTLKELVQDRWLCSTSDGNVGLGVRSFLDLRSWFRNNDVPSCDFCNEAAVKAELCQNEGCNVRIHDYCLKRFSHKRVKRVCPGCSTEWIIPMSKMELVEEDEGVEVSEPTQSQAGPSGSAKRRVRNRKNEVQTDTVTEGPSQHVPDLRRSTRRSACLR